MMNISKILAGHLWKYFMPGASYSNQPRLHICVILVIELSSLKHSTLFYSLEVDGLNKI